MFTGIYASKATTYNVVFTATAAITVILSAVYMLNMVQRVFYGSTNALTAKALEIRPGEKLVLAFIVLLILMIGVYPEPLFRLTQDAVDLLVSKMYVKP
jgi:NADH-quinone oxidoreductase subunit M